MPKIFPKRIDILKDMAYYKGVKQGTLAITNNRYRDKKLTGYQIKTIKGHTHMNKFDKHDAITIALLALILVIATITMKVLG